MDACIPEAISYPLLDPRIRVFRHGSTVDTFAVVTERYLVLIDTGMGTPAMKILMDMLDGERAGRELLVVNTHGDWDHVWGNELFVGPRRQYPAPIIGSKRTAELMRDVRVDSLLGPSSENSPPTRVHSPWCPPTILFDGELCIDGGDLTLTLFPTPGHTPDHVSIWIRELRLILAGDSAEMPFPLVSRIGSPADLRASLHRMSSLDPEILLCCHAPGNTSPELLQQNTGYFTELERRCRDRRADIRSHDDPAVALGWSMEQAIPSGSNLSDIHDQQFYRRFHHANIRAMVDHVDAVDST